MKKILIVDWLDKFGGAERVIASFNKIFNFDEVYTLINIMSSENEQKIFGLKKGKIKQTQLKFFKRKFRYFFFLFHFVISKIKIDKDINVVISSSHAVAKGVKKSSPNQLHISYFQARNFKFIWDEVDLYFGKTKFFFFPLIYLLRKIDCRQAQNPDFIISNSKYVQDWVKTLYHRESNVIYPPVDLSTFELETAKENYYVATGRLVPYKRFDIIVKAFNQNKKNLIIIGDGSERKKLEKISNANIIFKGYLDSVEIQKIVSKAKGFIHAGLEDFGIAPVEAQACGTPVIALGRGGVSETVIENETGVFFKNQTVESLIDAVNRFEKMRFNSTIIRDNAMRFSTERFEVEMKDYVESKWKEYVKNRDFI